MKHNINYKILPSYHKLISMGAIETTGKIQNTYGTIRFDINNYHYIIISNGTIERRPFRPYNASAQYLKDIKDIKDRSEEDYNEAFLFIIDKINGVRRQHTPWTNQLYQNKENVFNHIFGIPGWVDSYLKRYDNRYSKEWSHMYNSWNKYSVDRKLHYIMKQEGLLKKGRDYE